MRLIEAFVLLALALAAVARPDAEATAEAEALPEAVAEADPEAGAQPVRITAGSYRQPPPPGHPREEMVQKPSNKVEVVSVHIFEGPEGKSPIEALDSSERPDYTEITRRDREIKDEPQQPERRPNDKFIADVSCNVSKSLFNNEFRKF